MRTNKTDQRIIALFHKGISLERIAKRIGRPGDIERVKDALRDAEIPEERWRK